MAGGSSLVLKAVSYRSSLPLEGWAAGLFLLALSALAWAWLFRMGAASDIFLCRVGTVTLSAVAAMWAVMMIAMMIPSAVPMILAYAQETSRVERPPIRLGLVALFVSIYLIVWSALGAAAGGAEWLLSQSGFIRDGQIADPRYAGALLLIAGLYQWSAVKSVCLSHCHEPMRFLRRRYRGGYAGAVKLGLEHSTACMGCCWALMLLAFVGGAMNLGWMVVLTLFVALEKLIGTRGAFLRLSALALLLAGAVEMTRSIL
jgi:predicted metal-binding membrane protein